jgi:hypothetical protein
MVLTLALEFFTTVGEGEGEGEDVGVTGDSNLIPITLRE